MIQPANANMSFLYRKLSSNFYYSSDQFIFLKFCCWLFLRPWAPWLGSFFSFQKQLDPQSMFSRFCACPCCEEILSLISDLSYFLVQNLNSIFDLATPDQIPFLPRHYCPRQFKTACLHFWLTPIRLPTKHSYFKYCLFLKLDSELDFQVYLISLIPSPIPQNYLHQYQY